MFVELLCKGCMQSLLNLNLLMSTHCDVPTIYWETKDLFGDEWSTAALSIVRIRYVQL